MMGHRHTMALVAGAATLLATMPLAAVFDRWTWLLNGILAIAVVVGAATATRAIRGPAGVQVLSGMVALLLVCTWRFPSGQEYAGIVPSKETFRHFDELLRTAGQQIREQAIPVPDLDGLLLLAMAGIGMVAVLVDLAAVGIRRPALAGLPMLALYSVPVAVLPDGRVDFFAFAAAGAGYMWLLVSDSVDRVRRFGRRFSGEGRDVDVWEPSPLSAAGRRLGAVVIVAAVLLPLAVPSMAPTLLNRFAGGTGTGPGGGGTGEAPVTTVDMNAMLRDNLTLNEVNEMVVVRTNDPSPYYLRIGVAERVDENGFYSDLPRGGGVAVDEPLPNGLPGGVPIAGSYTAEITITGLSMSLAPIYTHLTGVEGLDSNWALEQNTGQVYSRSRNINGTRYTVRYTRLSYAPEALRAAPQTPPDLPGALTAVPASDYVSDLVAELTAGETNQYDRVRALYDYFSPENDFRYSLTTVDGDSGSAIVDFLENKQGFCVQYAAALTWLVREAGYAARVAFGFTRGSGRNGTYPLTNLNLHAWTEVYFPSYGWVPFDATPGNAVPGSVSPPWAQNPGTVPPVTPSAGPGQTATPPSTPRGVDPGEGAVPNAPRAPGSGLQVDMRYVLGGAAIVLVLVLLLAPSLQRRVRRRRRLASAGGVIALTPPLPGEEDLVTDPDAMTAAQRDAHNAWAELLDTMIDYGVLVDPAETPRTTAGRLTTTPQLSISGHAPAALLARVEERARYAPSPVRPTSLDEAIRAARKAFAEDATRLQRLGAAVFPRSVLMQWRTAWFGFTYRTSRRIGKIRDALVLVELRERRRRR